MRLLLALAPCLLLLAAAAASAQVIAPLAVSGPAQAALRQIAPPTPLEQVREQSMRRLPPLPLPAAPAERWVPERRVYAPELGRDLVVPGHFERRLSDQRYAVPALTGLEVPSGRPVLIPPADRPPVEQRLGP